MDLVTTAPAVQLWPDVFHQLVIANSRYWLDCARTKPDHFAQEIPQVLRALNYGLALPEAWQATRELIRHLSPLMIRRGQGVEWESFLIQGIARSAEREDSVEIEFRLHLGNLYRLQGRLPEARDCLQTGLDECDRYGTRQHYWALLNLLALAARLAGHHDEALGYCHQVLDSSDPSTAERAEALNVTGLVAYDRREWDKAFDQLDSALNLYYSLESPFQIARVLTNQGIVLQRKGCWLEAEKNYTEAIAYFQSAGDETEMYKAVTNLGNIYLMKKDFETAINHYEKALPVFQECNFLVTIAHIYNNLGMANTGLEKWNIAQHYFLASVKAWQKIEDLYNLANVLDNFGDMLIKRGETKQACEVLSEALTVLNRAGDSPEFVRLRKVIQNRLAEAGATIT